ncbi:MAG: hypothetical protein Q8M94_03265 [Ignavibacteria bacterium]|nr:hypothetical protein [Ignavibacteria bacterium]
MKLQKIKPPDNSGILKVTIHASGKLGFSIGAIRAMKIIGNEFIQIAINSEDETDQNLYAFITKEADENTLKINKAGNYYYVNTKALFDKLEIDYRKKKIIFDIVEIEYEGGNIFKLIRREKDRKKSK